MHRLFRNKEELEKLSELGVLFLLFEMGLELSVDRLKVIIPPHDLPKMDLPLLSCKWLTCQPSHAVSPFSVTALPAIPEAWTWNSAAARAQPLPVHHN